MAPRPYRRKDYGVPCLSQVLKIRQKSRPFPGYSDKGRGFVPRSVLSGRTWVSSSSSLLLSSLELSDKTVYAP